MELRTLHIAACIALSSILQAQVSTGSQPYSMQHGLSLRDVPVVRSASFDAASVAAEDAQRAALGKVPAYARILPLGADLWNSGQWMELPGGDRLWRLHVVSEGALATELYFNQFHMPDNASLHVYGEDGKMVLGGFTAYNNSEAEDFTTSLIPGQGCFLEYFEPAAAAGEGRLRVEGVGHAYRFVDEGSRAGDCEVDVNCSEGNNWHPQRDAVVRISIKDGGYLYWCSGALVNNLAEDCKPYFLTAQHCYEGNSQSDLNQWKFYFNYEKSNCGSGSSPSNRTTTGCYKRGASEDGGGNSGSDFLLVEGKTAIPSSYNPYWAGWDATGTGSTGGVGIHHPQGDRKKISTYASATQSDNWYGPSGTHWRVSWAATANGHGVTEEGSSGSPLFNSSKRIIGTLTGGNSQCLTPTSGTGVDYYGKMSYHWQSNPSPANLRLKNFLDPQGTGVKSMDGSYDPCGLHVGVPEAAGIPPALTIYPNPANGEASIGLPTDARDGVVEVRDLAGRLAVSEVSGGRATVRLRFTSLDAGTYLVRLMLDGRVVAQAPLIVLGR